MGEGTKSVDGMQVYDNCMRFYLHIIVALTASALVAFGIAFVWPPAPARNPDANHIHADFAVWVNGTELDFSATKYMSGKINGKERDLDPHFHLHDGDGHVMHNHKPDLPISQFFASLGLQMTSKCLTLDGTQFALLDSAWVKDFARTKKLCTDGKFHWTMVLNGGEHTLNPAYSIADGDKILFSYGASDTAWVDEWKLMTDDACRYSQTCPWRGPEPAEACVSDPTIPCRE